MTDIQLGPAIAVDGKRPEWLEDEDLMQWSWDNEKWFGKGVSARNYFLSDDHPFDFIRLPADHPHYRQTEAAVPEGMKAWHGGDAAPADWDSEKPIAVIDDGKVSIRYGDRWDWSREPVNAYGHKLLRVVAYTPVATPIDWSGELEAVHEDGRVVPAMSRMSRMVSRREMRWVGWPDNAGLVDSVTGLSEDHPGWRIRNVPQPTPQADTKLDLTEDGILDLDAARRHDTIVWDRMEALVRRMAVFDAYSRAGASDFRDEARAIVALLLEPEAVQPSGVPRAPCMTISEVREMVAKGEDAVIATMLERGYALPEPVDEDLIEARKLALKHCCPALLSEGGTTYRTNQGDFDDTPYMRAIKEAVARGRALALAGEKEA